jgi:hypothetical protein
MIYERGIDPSFLFDDNLETLYAFKSSRRHKLEKNIRIDFAQTISIDTVNFILVEKKSEEPIAKDSYIAQVSSDLKTWKSAQLTQNETEIKISIPNNTPVRYLRTNCVPDKVKEIKGYYQKNALPRKNWRISYLFDRFANRPAVKALSLKFKLDQYVANSYLCIPLEGKHGVEGAYAALRVGDTYIGAPRRSPSYPSNVWEAGVARRDSHYTYYIPITKDMIDKPLELVVLALDKANLDFTPSAWVTANPMPMVKKQLVLTRH